jgi:hypothetical protein
LLHIRLGVGDSGRKKDITKYEHSSARYYITGKHAGYKVVDLEQIIGEKMQSP